MPLKFNDMEQETLLNVARLCGASVLKAPQITGRVRFKMEILKGEEEISQIIEALMVFGRLHMFCMLSAAAYSTLLQEGKPPVILLIGALNLRQSELNWNCGSCGFKTCAEFNAYSKTIKEPPVAALIHGPVCNWKMIDYAQGCSWACATAWSNNITNRIEIASGMAAKAIGYLEDCDVVHGLPLGPMEELYWYSRRFINQFMTYDLWKERLQEMFGPLFQTFVGDGRAESKYVDKWWEKLYTRKVEAVDMKTIEETKKGIANDILEIKNRIKKTRG